MVTGFDLEVNPRFAVDFALDRGDETGRNPPSIVRVQPQLAELRRQTIGSLSFVFGTLTFDFGDLVGPVPLLGDFEIRFERPSVGSIDRQVFGQLEPDSQPGADPAGHFIRFASGRRRLFSMSAFEQLAGQLGVSEQSFRQLLEQETVAEGVGVVVAGGDLDFLRVDPIEGRGEVDEGDRVAGGDPVLTRGGEGSGIAGFVSAGSRDEQAGEREPE
jgi:hypothetical protein